MAMAQPELNHDAVTEILLRFPPDDPACLVRATLVCKPWRRILKDPAFLDRYRKFHRAPPLLGYLHSRFHKDLKVTLPCFVPTVAAPPFPKPPPATYRDYSRVIDSRHGRVLLDKDNDNFLVWDPVTGDCSEEVPKPDSIPCISYKAAVLCAITGCDHCNCHGGPFRVLIFGLGDSQGPVHACVYSSEARAWGTPVSLHLDMDSWFGVTSGSALIGEELYYSTLFGKILKFDFGQHRLSSIDLPEATPNMNDWNSTIPMIMEDGSLGLTSTRDSNLHLWSRKVKPDGVVGWVQVKVIELELEKLVPTHSKKRKLEPRLIGSAHGADVIFMSTDVGIFMFEFKSGQARKVGERFTSYGDVLVPFISFYTPDYAVNEKRRPWQQRHINLY